MNIILMPVRYYLSVITASLLFVLSLDAQPSADSNRVTVNLFNPTEQSIGGVNSSKNDIAHLKRLASGVGWEFAPNAETTDGLKRLGMNTIRCINVDNIKGEFDATGKFVMTDGATARLDANLATCSEISGRPHIIIAQNVPRALVLTSKDAGERFAILGQTPGRRIYWNGDWPKMHAYWKAIFHRVLVEKGFKNARFEVGNEPDIDGQFPRLVGKTGRMGSLPLFEQYFEVYEHVVRAAEEFEAENPGQRVVVGGPALAWAYSFRFGGVNWIERFLAKGAEKKLRIDFIGFHFYGNCASFDGEYDGSYPSFVTMLTTSRIARDLYYPGTPIILSEWGPTYHTNNKAESWVSADNVGAAWDAVFLKTMLDQKVDEAIYLVTTDYTKKNPSTKKEENNWGWPSLFVNPGIFGRAWPKAPAHVFDMVSRLSGKRIGLETKDDKGQLAKTGIDGIAAYDQAVGRVTMMLWNYAAILPENEYPTELGKELSVTLRLPSVLVQGTGGSGKSLRVKTWMVSKTMSNARELFEKEGLIDERSQLQLVDEKTLSAGSSDYTLTMPACSVAFMTIESP